MADCIIKSGGGSTPDGLTAVASLVYPGKTYVGSDTDGDVGTGTMATKSAATYHATTTEQTVPAKNTYMDGEQALAPVTQTDLSDGNVKAGVVVDVKAGDEVIHSASGTFTSGLTAVATQIYSGKVAYVNGSKVVGSMPLKAASTHYATSSSQTAVAANTYLTGNQTLAAISNTGLVASNIKSGVEVKISNGSANIWTPVTGTFSNGCDAVEANIYSGKTGYKNGTKITGQMPTKAASTYYATTSTQVAVAANTYVTGNQTLAALSQTNLAAGNIMSGVTITVKNGSATVWNPTGSFTSGVTAAASNVYTGAICYIDGAKKTGTMATKAASTHYAASGAVTAVAANTYVTGNQTLAALSQTNLSAANIKTGTVVTINNGSANVWTPVTGTFTSGGTATSAYIYSGKIGYVNGAAVTGKMTVKSAQTYSPTTTASTIASGQYLEGTQTITGYADLQASNIASDKTIWGITGTLGRPNANQTIYNGTTFGGYGAAGLVLNPSRITHKYQMNNANDNSDFTSGVLQIWVNHESGEETGYANFVTKKSIDFTKYSKIRITGQATASGGGYARVTLYNYILLRLREYANGASSSTAYTSQQYIIDETHRGTSDEYWSWSGASVTFDLTYDISSWALSQGFLLGELYFGSTLAGSSYTRYVRGGYWLKITAIYLSN